MSSPSVRLHSLCLALPAIVALAFLLVVSAFVYGNVFRPGLWIEVVLVLYVSSLLMQFQRRKLRGAIFNTLLLLAFYGAYLLKFLVLGEGISWSDISGLDELFAVLPMGQRLALVGVVSVMGVLFVTNLTRPPLLRTTLLLLPLVAYFVGSAIAPTTMWRLFEIARRPSLVVELAPWRDGPLLVAARQLPRVRAVRQFLTAASPPVADGMDVGRRARALATLPPPRRSVHIVVMESFTDPLNFRDFGCGFDPVDARFRRWITQGASLALSATFSGISARAEFEVLCGVPSYERMGVDFMSLGGATIPCLPELLRQRGYLTMATSTGASSFFNHGTAYPAVGFERRHLESDFVMTPENTDGELLSDEALYAQALEWIVPAMREGRPLLNYVLTFAGHYPFEMNPQRHPPVCPGDTLPAAVANAAHYNSIAAADYVEKIEAHDPDAIIVIMADHLPFLGVDFKGYRQADYRLHFQGRDATPFWAEEDASWLESRATTLIVRRARQPVSLGIIPHYLIPEALLDLLTDGAYCRATACLRKEPITYRPNGTRPVFTTPEAFPLSVCATRADREAPLCRVATQMERRLEGEYDSLLRLGVLYSTGAMQDEGVKQ